MLCKCNHTVCNILYLTFPTQHNSLNIHSVCGVYQELFLKKFLKDFIYLFLERGERRAKEKERNINVWLPLEEFPTGDLACNPGMCPDWESNQRPFGSQAGTQSTPARANSFFFFFFNFLSSIPW